MVWERFLKAPAMLHSIDRNGRLTQVSDLWLETLGYEREEVVGRPSTDFLTEESRRYAREVVLPEFFATGACTAEYEMVCKDGSVVPVRLRATAELDAEGVVLSSYAAIENLTEQRVLERRMVESQKLESLGLMAGGIAHDFNNLLVTILGNAQLALELNREQPVALASLTDIMMAARRAADLCRQLLAYSGRGRLQDEDIELSPLVQEVAQVLQVSVGSDALVKLDLAPDLHVRGDPTQLQQIVMNLVINAGEALDGHRGLINLVTSLVELDEATIANGSNAAIKPGLYACIEVADTGKGIEPAVMARIFDPFFTTKPAGHGLGLAAVHGIVRSHHGTITVQSSKGRGTSFKVYLPVRKGAISPRAKGSADRGTILVIDDDESVLKTLTRLLHHTGYQVLSAQDGEEGLLLAKARGQEIGAYLVDVSMPGLNGIEVAQRLHEMDASSTVVLMSGFNHEDAVRRAASRGIAGFLQKPFLLEQFEQILRAHRQGGGAGARAPLPERSNDNSPARKTSS